MNLALFDAFGAPTMQAARIQPSEGSQCWKLLRAFERGERLTVAEALSRFGVYALSQRAGELRKDGWPIADKWLTTPSGARVKVYFMGAE